MLEIHSMHYFNVRYAPDTSKYLNTYWAYVRRTLVIHSTYVIHSFSMQTLFQGLRSDIPELLRNIKLHTSNLRWTYIQCKHSASQHMPNIYIWYVPIYWKLWACTKLILEDVLSTWERITVYPYYIWLMPSVPILGYKVCQNTATYWHYVTYVGIRLCIFAQCDKPIRYRGTYSTHAVTWMWILSALIKRVSTEVYGR